MIPIQDLLHRIQWDPALRESVFAIGYVDRVEGRLVHVPFGSVRLGHGARAALTVLDADGVARRIPLHRIREVRQDGKVIWRRDSQPPSSE
jgi:uncharacterized protein (UPF0248 family)